MHVYFDLDNTIIDETGNNVRPGMHELLASFKRHGVQLSIWTVSVRERAEPILSIRPIRLLQSLASLFE